MDKLLLLQLRDELFYFKVRVIDIKSNIATLRVYELNYEFAAVVQAVRLHQYDACTFMVNDVTLHRDYRGRGLGKVLYLELMHLLTKHFKTKIYLCRHINQCNSHAVNVWNSIGRLVGQVDGLIEKTLTVDDKEVKSYCFNYFENYK
jgi:GNAT superfamily N-acetyltransferase